MRKDTKTSAAEAAQNETELFREGLNRVNNLRMQALLLPLTISLVAGADAKVNKQAFEEKLQATAEAIDHTVKVLASTDIFSDIPEGVSAWLARSATAHGSQFRIISRISEMTKDLCDAAQTGAPVAAEHLRKFTAFVEGDFTHAIDTLVQINWDSIDKERVAQMAQSAAAAQNLEDSLKRFEKIGKYVRAMAINASVEASHAGESGKGLAIIAKEFKALAEEVQELAASARTDIDQTDVA